MQPEERASMRVYSIIHAIISIVAMVAIYALVESALFMMIIYAVFLALLPTIMELIGRIGFYETDRILVGTGADTHYSYGNYTVFYGPLSVLRDLVLRVIGLTIPLLILQFILPETIFLPLFIFAFFYLIFHYVIYPLIIDLVWILSPKDPDGILAKLYIVITVVIVIAGIVCTAVFATYSTSANKDKLDLDAVLEEYFEIRGQRNPYADMDMSGAEPEFSKLSTRAELNFDQPITSDEGIVYPGSEMKLTYSVGSGGWTLITHEFTGEPYIASNAVYVGENQLQLGNFSGLAQIEITILSKSADGGNGIFKIIDKAGAREIFSTPFTFDGHVSGMGTMKFIFEKPLDIGPWEITEEEFKWDPIDHIYFFFQMTDFDLYLK